MPGITSKRDRLKKEYQIELASEKKERKRRTNKERVSEEAANYATELGSVLLLDQNGNSHIILPERPIVAYPIYGSVFRNWILGKYFELTGKGFSGEIFKQLCALLEAKAFHEDNVVYLHNRIAKVEDTIYYDLGDNKRVVEISREGWEINDSSSVLFRRFKHQKPQVDPAAGGDLTKVLKYVNLTSDGDKLLFQTYLVAVMIPDIPRCLLVCIGDQGGAKSTMLRVIRSLVDPSRVELLRLRRASDELALMASHHYCLFFDNLSHLYPESSDSLASFVTGVGFSKRKLFTDQDDIIFEIKAAVALSGINLMAEKPDLLDRCLILELSRIPEKQRIEEQVFWSNFNKEKPEMLGGLFTALSETLRKVPKIRLSFKPRMADYAKYATTAAQVLGKTNKEFLSAFRSNVERQNQAAIESSPVAEVMIEFMEDKEEWEGASSELHEILKGIAEKRNLKIGGSYGFPRSSNWLWKKINLVKSNLSALGIDASISKEASYNVITLLKSSKNKKNTSNIPNASKQAQNSMEVKGSNTTIPSNTSSQNQLQTGSMEATEVKNSSLDSYKKEKLSGEPIPDTF